MKSKPTTETRKAKVYFRLSKNTQTQKHTHKMSRSIAQMSRAKALWLLNETKGKITINFISWKDTHHQWTLPQTSSLCRHQQLNHPFASLSLSPTATTTIYKVISLGPITIVEGKSQLTFSVYQWFRRMKYYLAFIWNKIRKFLCSNSTLSIHCDLSLFVLFVALATVKFTFWFPVTQFIHWLTFFSPKIAFAQISRAKFSALDSSWKEPLDSRVLLSWRSRRWKGLNMKGSLLSHFVAERERERVTWCIKILINT